MDILKQDIRYAVRALVRSPGFAVATLLTLGLAIGVNTALFTVIQNVLLKPLPYRDAGEIVIVFESNPEAGYPKFSTSPLNFRDFRDENQVFEWITAVQTASASLVTEGQAERLVVGRVTDQYFRVFGIEPILGRGFAPEEDRPGAERVLMISHGFWQSRLGGAADVEGQTIELDGEPHTVIGVAPPNLPLPFDVWRPLAIDYEAINRGAHFLTTYARLKKGVTSDQAEIAMRALSARLEQSYPESNAGWSTLVVPLLEQTIGDVRPRLLMLWAAVAAVLLIACVNLANLFLGRLGERRRELSIRTALGAPRGRFIRQTLTESILLALLGGVAGVALAALGTHWLVRLAGTALPRADEVHFDPAILGFAVGLAVLTGVLFGLVPALWASRGDALRTLTDSGARGSSAGGHRLRAILVFGEVALATALLIGAGLLLRSFEQLQQIDPEFTADGVMTGMVNPPSTRYGEPATQAQFYRQIVEEVDALPEIEQSAAIFPLPYRGGWALEFYLAGQPIPPPNQRLNSEIRFVTPNYFETLQIQRLKGRDFNEFDTHDAPRVLIVNQAAAELFWPGDDPIGQQLTFNRPDGEDVPWWTVVGVAANARHRDLSQPMGPEIYQALLQSPPRVAAIVARTSGSPQALANGMKQAVQRVDPLVPIFRQQPFVEIVDENFAGPRFQTVLLGLFAGLALILAVIGVYGVISHSVNQSQRELGIRLALGSPRGRIVRQVLTRGMLPVLAGLGLGLALAVLAGRQLAGLLHEVSTSDGTTFTLVPLILLAVASLACLLPARRASRVDPMEILREE